MSAESDRNPSPPPEILSNDDLVPDRIGSSVYSKQWVYKALWKIAKWNPDASPEIIQKAKDDSNSVAANEDAVVDTAKCINSSETETDMVDLDNKVEEDACALWDMTAHKEVVLFLNKTYLTDIFLDVIDKTKSPRLLEIIVGILGNMSSTDSVCQNFSQNSRLLHSMIMLTGTTDTPTLLQVIRVISCGVVNEKCQEQWFNMFAENPFAMENLKFIFENSLNSELINAVFKLVRNIFIENPSYCKVWGQRSYTKSIIRAGKQLLDLGESLDHFFCVLELLCQYTPNVKDLVENDWEDLNTLHNAFLLRLGAEDPAPDRVSTVASFFNICVTFLDSEYINHELVKIDIKGLKAVHKISCFIYTLISDIKQANPEVLHLENPGERLLSRKVIYGNGFERTESLSEYEVHEYNNLFKTIMEMAKILLTHAEKDEERDVLEDILNSEEKENVALTS